MSKLALFFSRLDAFDPIAIGIAVLAMIVMVSIVYAVTFWHECRQLRREQERRRFRPIRPCIPADVARHLRSL
jgi:hypothetical protein